MKELESILGFLEERIDPEHIEDSRQTIKKQLFWKHVERPVIKLQFSNARFSHYPYSLIFNDMEKMMINELVSGNLCSICNYVEVKDHTVPMIRADYGVSIVPSLFKLNYTLKNDDKPWVEHVKSIDDIYRIIDCGIPNSTNGLGTKVFETYEYYKEVLSRFPNCDRTIALYHPDLQGPFDVAHLIWGSDIYIALYDDSSTVHRLLDLVTQTYIAFLRRIKQYINDEYDGFVYQWGTLYSGGVVLRDDTAVNLSKEMYQEFVKPYDEAILESFGGGSIHYCGKAPQWLGSMMDSRYVEALNFGQPPNMTFGYEFLDEIYEEARSKKVAVVDYMLDKDDVLNIADTAPDTGVTYGTFVDGIEEAKILLERCRG